MEFPSCDGVGGRLGDGSDSSGPLWGAAGVGPNPTSVKMRSSVFPHLWVRNLTCCSRPIASMVLLKMTVSLEDRSSMWMLKSPSIILFLCLDNTFVRYSVIVSINMELIMPSPRGRMVHSSYAYWYVFIGYCPCCSL